MIHREPGNRDALSEGDAVVAPVVEALRSYGKTGAEDRQSDRLQERTVLVSVCHSAYVHAALITRKPYR